MNIHRVEISGVAVSIFQGKITIDRSDDFRSTCKFVVEDSTGTAKYNKRETVTVYSPLGTVKYTGYIDKVSYANLNPSPENQIEISCVDQSDLATTRFARRDYVNQLAGDIAADLLNTSLAQVGVNGRYAVRRDSNKTQLGLGTLSG